MRISELSTQTGMTVPTIKYYLREGLLPEGERSSPTQATYGDKHVERLRVIRALLDAGVSIAETRRVLTALDEPPEHSYDLLGTAHAAITPPLDEALDLNEAERIVSALGWKPGTCDLAVLNEVARAVEGLERAGFVVPNAVMREYLASMRRIADAEIAGVPTESPEAAVRYVVLGSVLVEPLLLALRRVAQQVSSWERFGGEG
ncbi:DNA-binding transcriptional MerR regulator [Microbacterium halimionae]|uniref:DNA-binding transcriptional MerR regulator n=1 Tax=Microbacterium halimionae TaxID=1526413 RepID=A0A7W3PMD0_9MICO|nr:MerR family transcriptional regulator [Microbacterium halimionae]MBA8816941.1 DNA-binding transcriptional MerR regulator [Microbacterium halimionae]NII94520.1 DNA-binding transcriptional MerR regulator [Microbacterium halimionae]